MRRIFGGGRKNYNEEFILQAQGKGRQALAKIEKAFGEGFRFSEQDVDEFGTILYKHGTVELGKVLIDEALGLNETLKKKAMAYLQIERKDQATLKAWKEILNVQSDIDGSGKKDFEGEIKSVLESHETHRKLLDAKIDQIASYEGITREEVMRKKKYRERYDEALEFLSEHYKSNSELVPGSDAWEEYVKILMPSDQLLARDLGYFRALNIMNSSGYNLNMERMNDVARILGFKDFDAEDFMGLDKRVFFHQHLPTASSYRAYDVVAAGGMNPQGMSLERVATIC